MNIMRIDELRLSDAQETAIADLLETCMSLDYERRSFFQNRFHCRFIAQSNGSIIGHLGLDFRAICLGTDVVSIIGIGDVAVHPDHRRQGIGGKLVEACLQEGREARAEFALLFGVKSIYENAGFEPAKNNLRYTNMRGAKTADTVDCANGAFKVCQLGSRVWNQSLPVDLAGYPF